MLAASRLIVLQVTGLVCVIALPMGLASRATSIGNAHIWAPMFVFLEIAIYFTLTFFANPRMGLDRVATIALVLAVLRFIGSAVGGMLGVGIGQHTDILVAWVGNPISVLLQVVTLLLVCPHVLDALAPESLDAGFRARLGGGGLREGERRGGQPAEATPSGGFIQVFGYDELAAVVGKTAGLEGFLLCSGEGLVVWRDLPMRIEVDALAARLLSNWSGAEGLVNDCGLSRLRRLVVQTREHTLCVADLNASFSMILVYGARVSIDHPEARVDMLVRTAREFLQWKYPGLTVTPSASQVGPRSAV